MRPKEAPLGMPFRRGRIIDFKKEESKFMEYTVKSYPDGSKYVEVGAWKENLVFRINTYEDLWILNQIHDVLRRRGTYTTLTIPNLLDAQADRRFAENQPHGLKLVCEFLNGLTYFKQINIFHPHNAEVVEAMIDRAHIIDNHDFIYEVLAQLKNDYYDNDANLMESKLILMSSDAGGFKPLMKLADKLEWQGETYSASKSRKYEAGHSKLVQLVDKSDFEGKDILIVDDICVYGGTFKGLSKLLKERTCGKLFLAVSHITVQNLGEDPVTNYFENVFTTDSKFDTYYKPIKFHGDTSSPTNLKIITEWN